MADNATGPRTPESGDVVLEVLRLTKTYGQLTAVDDVSLSVAQSECRGLIGPNGAGKSTLFQLIAGRTETTSGQILFDDSDITRTPEYRRIRDGMAVTFQTSELFESLTVEENLSLGVRRQLGLSRRWFRPATTERVSAVVGRKLDQFSLGPLSSVVAAELSHGERRQLEIALALVGEPRLLMLDEPVAGMSPEEITDFMSLLSHVRGEMAIIIIEHNLEVVAELADKVTVLDAGRIIAEGPPRHIAESDAVQEAYLGAHHGEGFSS